MRRTALVAALVGTLGAPRPVRQPILGRPPRLTVRFGPVGPPRPHVFRGNPRGGRGSFKAAQHPRIGVAFCLATSPKPVQVFRVPARRERGRFLVRPPLRFIPAVPPEGRAVRIFRLDQRGGRGRVVIVRPNRPLVPLGPLGPPRIRVTRRDERGSRGFFIPARPPIKYAFFQTPGLERVRLFRLDRRGTPGRYSAWEPPRPRVTFGAAVVHTPKLFRLDQRGSRGWVKQVRGSRFNPAPVVVERTYTALEIEAGYEAILFP